MAFVTTGPNPKAVGPSLVSCAQLLIHYSSNQNLRTCHVIVRRDLLNREYLIKNG